ncbi:MAG: hypothetical protein ACRCXT_19650 [Paraclostridium sp.]
MGSKTKILVMNSGLNDYEIHDDRVYQYTPNGNVLVLGSISEATQKELSL